MPAEERAGQEIVEEFRERLLRIVFPNGPPEDPLVAERATRWLDEAGRIVRHAADDSSFQVGSRLQRDNRHSRGAATSPPYPCQRTKLRATHKPIR